MGNNWSFSGFTKSVLLGAVSGFFTGGLASVFSATGFLATTGVGALTGGVGYEFEKFTLDARYNYQTNDYLKDSSDANSLKINYFNIGLGYKF